MASNSSHQLFATFTCLKAKYTPGPLEKRCKKTLVTEAIAKGKKWQHTFVLLAMNYGEAFCRLHFVAGRISSGL